MFLGCSPWPAVMVWVWQRGNRRGKGDRPYPGEAGTKSGNRLFNAEARRRGEERQSQDLRARRKRRSIAGRAAREFLCGEFELFSECGRGKSKASVGVGRIIIDMVQRAEGRRTSGKRAGPGGPAQTWGSAPLERTALRSLTWRRRNQKWKPMIQRGGAETRRRKEVKSKPESAEEAETPVAEGL
jgi:hypothetical protein